jgi:hypothetical protein
MVTFYINIDVRIPSISSLLTYTNSMTSYKYEYFLSLRKESMTKNRKCHFCCSIAISSVFPTCHIVLCPYQLRKLNRVSDCTDSHTFDRLSSYNTICCVISFQVSIIRQRDFVRVLEALYFNSEARRNVICVNIYSTSSTSRIILSSCCEVTKFSITQSSFSTLLLKRVPNDNFDTFQVSMRFATYS